MTGRVAREESVLLWFSPTVGTDSKAVHSTGREVSVGPLQRGRAAASLLPWLETATGTNRLHLPSLAPAPAVALVGMLCLGLPTPQSPPKAPAVSVAGPPPLAGHSTARHSRQQTHGQGEGDSQAQVQQDLWSLGVSEHCSGFP